jgi:FixJ family two-component response regulator
LARKDKPLAEDRKALPESRSIYGRTGIWPRLWCPWQLSMATRRNLVAIVDDDPDLREALGQMLEMSGYAVELYASGEAFLSAAATSEAACLVLDVQLGDITGVELSRQLSAHGFKFPTVFISGSTKAAFQRAAMDLGCVAYLRKPFLTRQLIEAIVAASGSVPEGEGQ